jgi:ubiquinone/menaquinone biosynthesis C-methylase UbiE
METLVHVDNPKKVLGKFYEMLKPNGKLVMFEYSHAGKNRMPGAAFSALTRVNHLAAMPGFQRFTHGKLESLLNGRGYVSIESDDISANVLPMLRAFSTMAYLPYKVASFINPSHKMANVMSAVEFYKYRDYIHYNVISARKPK